MPRTTPAEQTAGHTVTTTEYNDQLIKNLNFLLGLKRNGSALTGLADGAEIISNLIASNGANPIITSSGITISSIPQTYRHLRLIVTCQSNDSSGSRGLFVRVGNGGLDTGANYYRQSLSIVNTSGGYNNDVAGTNLLNSCALPLSTGLYGYLDMLIMYYTGTGNNSRRGIYQYSSSLSTAAADQVLVFGSGTWTGITTIDTVGFLANTGDMRNIRYELYGVV